jgi:hypothetical protein
MRVLKIFLPGLAIVLLAGCAGYKLGAVGDAPAGARTIEVQPFNNQTLQPRLGDDMTQAVRERVQTDATYRLVTGETGDLILSGRISNYQRDQLGYLNQDSSTPQNFRVSVTVHVVVRDRASGKVVMDRDIKGHTLVNVGPDFASSERQAGPLLAQDAAQNIISQLAEGIW